MAAAADDRHHAEQFFEALATRDPDRFGPYLDENVDWLIVGPIEIFPYCGQHSGKAAVLAAYAQIACNLTTLGYVRDFLIVEDCSASALARLTVEHKASGRQVNIRHAQFVRFRDSKVVESCSIIDSLGAVEQVLGHALDLAEALATTAADHVGVTLVPVDSPDDVATVEP
jgi:ketosteroid isomerase-like protein